VPDLLAAWFHFAGLRLRQTLVPSQQLPGCHWACGPDCSSSQATILNTKIYSDLPHHPQKFRSPRAARPCMRTSALRRDSIFLSVFTVFSAFRPVCAHARGGPCSDAASCSVGAAGGHGRFPSFPFRLDRESVLSRGGELEQNATKGHAAGLQKPVHVVACRGGASP